ncbi:MAG: Stealth CR1 domain-containing protein, partial [Clostridia bacterium]|nr:Stealth CR1 domain-containing protein [Clostridia bacterium]
MDIDFVVLWVDGNDPEWLAEKRKYQSEVVDDSNAPNRFRDWGLMPYWFRAIEKFTPWVRKIHFVTCGHIPPWLNTEHPKLNHVKHSDYIPSEYLPTFSANTIEMNIHRIPDLAEHFVFFNDDTLITRKMEEKAFFNAGLPCCCGIEVPAQFRGSLGIWQHLIANDLRVVNNHFNKRDQLLIYRRKYVN